MYNGGMMEDYVSDEDKIHIINQHIKNYSYNKYNLEVSLLAENALTVPDPGSVDSLLSQIQQIDQKISALENERNSIEGV